MKLTQDEWAALWITEGGPISEADTASAIVMAESGGNTKSVSPTNDYGGYQINLPAHPDVSKKCAFDPTCATRKAIGISQSGSDFSPWVTYQNGDYSSYVGKSFAASASSGTHTKNVSIVGDLKKQAEKIVGGIPGLPAVGGAAEIFGKTASELVGKVFNIVGLGDIAKVIEGFGELFLTREGWARMAKLIGGFSLFIWGLKIVVRESTGTDPIQAGIDTGKKAAATAATIATVK